MSEDTKRIGSREFTAEVIDSLIDDRERLIDYAHETNKQADEYLELALLRQRERDEALAQRDMEIQGRESWRKIALGNTDDTCPVCKINCVVHLKECQSERDEAQHQWKSWEMLADLSRKRAEKAEHVSNQARAVARRLYHDWDARTVRSLQEIADENPWIVERES